MCRIFSLSLPLLTGLVLLAAPVSATSAHARPCLEKSAALKTAKADQHVHYRLVQGQQCWYAGIGADKSEFDVQGTARTGSTRSTDAAGRVAPDKVHKTSRRVRPILSPSSTRSADEMRRALCGGVRCWPAGWPR